MKKIVGLFILSLSIQFSKGQESGMQFQHGVSWIKILATAKQENKYIFVDCFATWCGPCKKMAKEIFVLPAVGDFYNAHYVNVKAQMDSSAKDDDMVKASYADNHDILVKYGIQAYPTYLIFSPSGELVQRFVGSMPEDQFISKGKEALMPDKQYYTQLRKFQAGDRNPEFLYSLANMSAQAMDKQNQKQIADAYLATQANLFTKNNIELLYTATEASTDKGFRLIMDNQAAVDSVLGKGAARDKIRGIIIQEQVLPVLSLRTADSNTVAPNWNQLHQKLEGLYPAYANELTSFSKVLFFRYSKQWKNFGPAVCEYMKSYGNGTPAQAKNDYAWTVFENCHDQDVLTCALGWAKELADADYASQDTYANLLYATGQKKEAIALERTAVERAKSSGDPGAADLEKTLREMESK